MWPTQLAGLLIRRMQGLTIRSFHLALSAPAASSVVRETGLAYNGTLRRHSDSFQNSRFRRVLSTDA